MNSNNNSQNSHFFKMKIKLNNNSRNNLSFNKNYYQITYQINNINQKYKNSKNNNKKSRPNKYLKTFNLIDKKMNNKVK